MGVVRWKPTSAEDLEQVESKLLSFMQKPHTGRFVDIGSGWGRESNQMWTISMDATSDEKKLPLVLMHGFGCGSGIWVQNMDDLSSDRRVYAFDVLGFGRSSRPTLGKDADAESDLVDSVERWRRSIGLNEPFVLLGHSFGGYLSLAYALKFPDHVSHVILADPWGIPTPESAAERTTQIVFPAWARVVARFVFNNFNPLAGLRVAGPWGPSLMRKMRPDIQKKFEPLTGAEDSGLILDYVYHCNAQSRPTGEMAFKSLSANPAFAKSPIIERLETLDEKIDLSFIHGGRTWMFRQPEEQIKLMCSQRSVESAVIDGAGHHVYADNLKEFNRLVKQFCSHADDRLTTKKTTKSPVTPTPSSEGMLI